MYVELVMPRVWLNLNSLQAKSEAYQAWTRNEGVGEIPRAQAFIQSLLNPLDVHYQSGKLSYSDHTDQPLN